MLSYQILGNLKSSVRASIATRNIGILGPCLQKATDPVQQLFIDKIREYKQKSDGGKKLVEPSPMIERELKSELEKVKKVYGGADGVDMTKFPTLKFPDVEVDSVNLEK